MVADRAPRRRPQQSMMASKMSRKAAHDGTPEAAFRFGPGGDYDRAGAQSGNHKSAHEFIP